MSEQIYSKKNKKRIIIIIIGALISAVYLNLLRGSVRSLTEASIEELAIHDMKSLSAKIDDLWGELDSVYYRTSHQECTSVQELCSRLNLERQSNVFEEIYLLDTEGNTYSSNNVVMDQSDKDYVQRLLSGKEQVIRRLGLESGYDYGRERIVYGVRCEPFTCGDVTFVGIFGEANSDAIRNMLKIRSFDGRGYTSIMDMKGDYLVNHSWLSGISTTENYYASLQTDVGLSEEEINTLRSRLDRKETFTERYDCQRHGAELVSYFPMEKAEWIITITIPEDVLAEQTAPFVHLSGTMLVALVVLMIAVLGFMLWAMTTTISARADVKAKESFVASMSHEIRTPLSSIMGLNSLMREHLDEPERMREYLRKSGTAAQYLLTLVNDVLDLAKLQAGKIDLEDKPFSLEYSLSAAESIIGVPAEEKGLEFHVDKELVAPNLVGDSMRLQQILVNLLNNAVKFTPSKGRVSLRVRQQELHDGRVETTYEVEDTGCGMSSNFLEEVFTPFAQERTEVSDGTRGTGLGMAISQLLAVQMGGSLTVRSELNVGSCFTLKLTNEVSNVEPEALALKHEMPLPESKQQMNVLLAEDNVLNADILTELLEMAGFTVVHAADGGQVVDLFKASESGWFDLILMDVQMPVRNGYEATKMIRGLNRPDAKTVKIYACTANALRQDREQAAVSGMDDFIAKPVNVKKLLKMLNGEQDAGGEAL